MKNETISELIKLNEKEAKELVELFWNVFCGEASPKELTDKLNYKDTKNVLRSYKLEETAISRSFEKASEDISDILARIVLINVFYSTNLHTSNKGSMPSVMDLAKIIECKYSDDDIKNKEDIVNVVKTIAEVSGKDKVYSFASKYCNFIQPEKYPIIDSYTRAVLYYYFKETGVKKYTQEDLKDYSKYVEAINKFKKVFLGENCDINYKKLDVFLWLYGKLYGIKYD